MRRERGAAAGGGGSGVTATATAAAAAGAAFAGSGVPDSFLSSALPTLAVAATEAVATAASPSINAAASRKGVVRNCVHCARDGGGEGAGRPQYAVGVLAAMAGRCSANGAQTSQQQQPFEQ